MIHAGLASIPARENSLSRTIASLLPQVDRITVYLNGYARAPTFLAHPRITVARSQEHGDRGDCGKFFGVTRGDHYELTCDDDLVYPLGYAERLADAIERHGRRAAVGFHGAVFAAQPQDLHTDRVERFHCLYEVEGEHRVHLLGTGVLGFHAKTLRIGPDSFPRLNVADTVFAVEAQRQAVPLIALPHAAGWLEHTSHEDTIFDHTWRQTGSAMDVRSASNRLISSVSWQLHT